MLWKVEGWFIYPALKALIYGGPTEEQLYNWCVEFSDESCADSAYKQVVEPNQALKSDFIKLKQIIEDFPLGINSIICHTSGPVPLDVLSSYATGHGVVYPLQSLTKHNLKDLLEVPIFVEWSSPALKDKIYDLADSISNKVREVSSADRLKYHLAAVFANNYTNVMYDIAERYLSKEGLDFKYLLPIIKDTANRIKITKPRQVQTGPASRGDEKIIEKHLEMLDDEKIKLIYRQLANFIMTKSWHLASLVLS